MNRFSKIAISLPKEDLGQIEEIRKKLGLERSTVIDMAIRFWLKNLEEKEMVKRYEEGYKNKPESVAEIKAMEKASAEAFKEEEWE
ncbi:MAG: hypothetical protein Q8O30_08040 [Candidatus Omnitrophota bacterium]|nr:hypothetical protein [Candidatus Omnitrophota bacterium]